MASNTFLGKLNPFSAVEPLANMVGDATTSLGTLVAKQQKITQDNAEYAAATKQSKVKGRAANMLSDQPGSLVQPGNLGSASKQLLGS